jgi:hypothetical protein
MKEISSLTTHEKVFLAGCIKNMIMADGAFGDPELNELDVLLDELDFTDYEEYLEEFENGVTDSDSFWEMAETIEDRETQEMILEVLYDLSIQKGLEESAEKNLLSSLKEIWQV